MSRKGLLHHLAICLEEATTSAEEPPTNHRLKSHTIIDHPFLSPARWLSKDSTPHPQAGRWGLVIVSGWFQDPKRCISPCSAACKGKTQRIILEVHLVALSNHPAASSHTPPGFTCDELDHFYRVFQRFDRDSSDTMCASEFSNALTWLGFPYGPEKLQVHPGYETRQRPPVLPLQRKSVTLRVTKYCSRTYCSSKE